MGRRRRLACPPGTGLREHGGARASSGSRARTTNTGPQVRRQAADPLARWASVRTLPSTVSGHSARWTNSLAPGTNDRAVRVPPRAADRPHDSTSPIDRRTLTPVGPSFADDIRPLFGERDRRSMAFLFDLWDYEAVKARATTVLAAVERGDMPCDDPWPEDRVALLRRWVEAGCAP